MTEEERVAVADDITRRAWVILSQPNRDPDAYSRALSAIHRASELRARILSPADDGPRAVPPAGPEPHDERARAREADELNNLRAGRDQCTATRRDGEQCRAPAIEGALVCRRHGGAAPQVRIAAKHLQLQLRLYITTYEHKEARGTPREFDALCKALQAARDLDAYEASLAQLTELRAALRRRKATQPTPDAGG